METGEEKAWNALRGTNPDEVCRRTDARFDPSTGLYTVQSFGMDIAIAPNEKRMYSDPPGSDLLLKKLGYFFSFSALCYLTMAKDVPLSGRLIQPINMKSGQLFFRGSHVLPLDTVAKKFRNDSERFLNRGMELGGESVRHGDAALRLLPLPKVPVVSILWKEDEEFPARADLLFDSSVEVQLPIDVVWSIAMLSVLVLA